ncbi:hypothetical protein VTJ04DRAFT_1654 [Mycothermus thermophilus]|uniref:uncharacterized protein n=1 Tax=Humicola insolens TaxID=85995 RepID=UPI003743A8B4
MPVRPSAFASQTQGMSLFLVFRIPLSSFSPNPLFPSLLPLDLYRLSGGAGGGGGGRCRWWLSSCMSFLPIHPSIPSNFLEPAGAMAVPWSRYQIAHLPPPPPGTFFPPCAR